MVVCPFLFDNSCNLITALLAYLQTLFPHHVRLYPKPDCILRSTLPPLSQLHGAYEERVARASAHDLPPLDVPQAPPLPSELDRPPPIQVAAILRKVRVVSTSPPS